LCCSRKQLHVWTYDGWAWPDTLNSDCGPETIAASCKNRWLAESFIAQYARSLLLPTYFSTPAESEDSPLLNARVFLLAFSNDGHQLLRILLWLCHLGQELLDRLHPFGRFHRQPVDVPLGALEEVRHERQRIQVLGKAVRTQQGLWVVAEDIIDENDTSLGRGVSRDICSRLRCQYFRRPELVLKKSRGAKECYSQTSTPPIFSTGTFWFVPTGVLVQHALLISAIFRRMSSILLWCVEWEEESLAWRGSRIYISLALRLLDLQCFTLIFPSWVLLGAIQDPLWTPPCRTFMQGRHKLSFLRSLTPVGAVAGRVIGSPSRERQVAASCLSSCSYPAFGRSPRWG